MIKKQQTTIWLFALVLTLFFHNFLCAQSSMGSMSIQENGFISVFGEHNFSKGSGFIASGMIRTCRTGAKGYLNFAKGSSWVGADEERFVDGYVMVYHSEPFVFPIGQGKKYKPIAISGAAKTSAAYYDKDPESLGINIPSKEGTVIDRVSNREYWDINGDQPTTITLSWDNNSNIANITGGQLESLKVIGLKNGQWEIVPSDIEKTLSNKFSSEAGGSDFSKGAISTSKAVIPNDYEYFTLGSVGEAEDRGGNKADAALLSVYPNPVQSDVFINLKQLKGKGNIKVYNSFGQLMLEQAYNNVSGEVTHLDTSNFLNGVYEIVLDIEHKQLSRKFVVQRLY